MQIDSIKTTNNDLKHKKPMSSINLKGNWLWVGPIVFMLLISIYYIIRYQGNWAEIDTAAFSSYIRAMYQDGNLVPRGGVYSNGYAFPAISTYILALTGLDVSTLQQFIYPLVIPLTVLPAWLLYRELTGTAQGAAFTTILIFTQPEFLFVISRSTHEKFTRTLLFLSLYWLVRSFKVYQNQRLFIIHIILFYLTTYAMIASNNLISNSFIFTVMLSLVIGWILNKLKPHLQLVATTLIQRLVFVSLICLGIIFIFTFYAYPPATNSFQILKNIWLRISALFLDVQNVSTNSYTQIAGAWVSLPVYFLLSLANWIILVVSFSIWLKQGWQWLWKNQTPVSQEVWILWLFYTAFAIQAFLSILSDSTGYLSGNLQLRLFPSFNVVAVAMVGATVTKWKFPSRRVSQMVKLGLTVSIFIISILSVLKATNEPILSNKWIFYQPNELQALSWIDLHITNAEIWTDFDERLTVAFSLVKGQSSKGNTMLAFSVKPTTRILLMTNITELRMSRLMTPLPIPPNSIKFYDNGNSYLYRLRPQTIYQR